MRNTFAMAILAKTVYGLAAIKGTPTVTNAAPQANTRPTKIEFFTNKQGLAAGGNDVVANFDGKIDTRSDEFEAVLGGDKFVFASQAHKDAFVAAPEKYAPQYGGSCAIGMAGGHKTHTDAASFTVAAGQPYLNHSPKVAEMWAKDMERLIAKADANWPTAREK